MLRSALRLALIVSLALPMLTLGASSAFAEDVIDHAPFDAVLTKYVDRKGRVDYAGLKRDSELYPAFEGYLKSVADADPKGASKKARLAFYSNAYNANVINLVLETFDSPTRSKSVIKVDGFFDSKTFTVAGKRVSLNHLEKKIIIPTFKEPRIHFILVCAAHSCPRLRPKALTEKNVRGVMERAAREFVSKSTSLRDDGSVSTSKIFEWYAGDFEKGDAGVADYLAGYLEKAAGKTKKAEKKERLLATAKALRAGSSLGYSEYDWALNAR